jgi:hypothetical protein
MFMGNKVIMLLLMAIFLSCDKNAECKVEDIDGIYFVGFDNLRIKKISFKDLKDQTNKLEYLNPILDSVDVEMKELKINKLTSNLIKNGFIITINERIKYKITNVEMEEIYIEKNTMFGRIYGCCLKEYRLNDSLIESHTGIIIYK